MATQLQSQTAASPKSVSRVDQFVGHQLKKTTQQVRVSDIVTGLIAIAVFVIAFFLLAAIIDAWVWAFNPTARLMLLATLLSGLAIIAWYFVLPFFFRRINPEYAAKMIEEAKPEFKNSLLNYLSLKREKKSTHRAILNEVSRKAATDLSSISPDAAVDKSNVITTGFLLVGLVAIAVAYFIFSPKNPWPTVMRILSPGSKISKPAAVLISNVEPGDASIFFGDKIEVTARISGVTENDHVAIVYSTKDEQIIDANIPMNSDGGGMYSATLTTSPSGIQQSLRYRIEAGDGSSPVYSISVRPNPTINIESIKVTPPKYTKLNERIIEGNGEIQAVEGAKVEIRAQANMPIELAYIVPMVASQNNNGSYNEKRSIQMKSEKTVATGRIVAALNSNRDRPQFTHYKINFRSIDQHKNENPNVYPIRVIADLAPELEILEPATTEVPTPVNQPIPIKVWAADLDYEVSAIDIQVEHKGSRIFEKNLFRKSRNQQPGERINASTSLTPEALNLEPGDRAIFFVTAADNRVSSRTEFPDPNVTRSENYTIIVTDAVENESGRPPQESQEPGDQPNGQQQSGSDESNNGDSQDDDQSNDSDGNSNVDENGGSGSESSQDSDQGDSSEENVQSESESGSSEEKEQGDENSQSDQDGNSQSKQEKSDQYEYEQEGSEQSEQESSAQSDSSGQDQEAGSDSSSQSNESPKDQQTSDQQTSKESSDTNSDQQDSDPSESGDSESAASQNSNNQNSNSQSERESGTESGLQDSQNNESSDGSHNSNSGKTSDGSPQQSAQQSDNSNGKNDPGGQSENDGVRDHDLRDGQVESLRKNASLSEQFEQLKEYFDNNDSQSQSQAQQNQQENNGQSQNRESDSHQDAGSNSQTPPSEPKNPDLSQKSDQNPNSSGENPSQSQNESGNQNNSNQNQNTGLPNDDSGNSQSENHEQPSNSTDNKQQQSGGNASEQDQQGSPSQAQDAESGGSSSESDMQSLNSGSQSGDSKSGNAGDPQSQSSGQPSGSEGSDQDGGQETSQSSSSTQSTSSDSQKAKGSSSGPQQSNGQPTGTSSSDNASSSSETGGNENSGNKSGIGGSDSGNKSPSAEMQAPNPDKANLEYTKKLTDLILDQLEDQKYEPDPELLEQMNWNEQDLDNFLKQWQAMKKKAQTGDVGSKRDYEDALRSLGFSPKVKGRKVEAKKDKKFTVNEDGAVDQIPAEYADKFKSFLKRRNRTKRTRQ